MARAKVLIVEDDDLTLAGDGFAALGLLGEDSGFAAVLLDRIMPGMDGREVLKGMVAEIMHP
ncbi:MAG: response regulator transcription factor [Holophaga sp.]|nr:response regulator transcription factor [Holophaga sp.]